MACRLIALYVTVEQEIAIRKLFYEKGWTYQPEGIIFILVKTCDLKVMSDMCIYCFPFFSIFACQEAITVPYTLLMDGLLTNQNSCCAMSLDANKTFHIHWHIA